MIKFLSRKNEPKVFKKVCIFKVASNNSGIIIYVVLWALMILTSLALSLGRNTQIDLALTKHSIGQLKSEELAWAAVSFAAQLIFKDSADTASNNSDTLLYCGIAQDAAVSLKDLFENHKVKDDSFNIFYTDSDGRRHDGLEDQRRFININTFSVEQQKVFINLITSFGFDEKLAEGIAASTIDWRDSDNTVTLNDLGAEDDYYMHLDTPYHCKNKAFDTKEELLLVKGMTQEIFDKIKDSITIFPKEGTFQINFNTASPTVLESITRSASGAATNTDVADADSLVKKILDYRRGDDAQEATADDRDVDLSKINLNDKEKTIALVINQWMTKRSDYFKVHAKGQDDFYHTSTEVEAVIERDSLRIVSWMRH